MWKGRWDRPGPGSACGGLWTTGLQDRLVSTMAAMISSISTDSGLRKLDTRQRKALKPKHPHTQAGVSSSLPVWRLPAPASLWPFHQDFLGLGRALWKRLHTKKKKQWASMISNHHSFKTQLDRFCQSPRCSVAPLPVWIKGRKRFTCSLIFWQRFRHQFLIIYYAYYVPHWGEK